jgi:nucleotidyltransferase substrate binding protein (TIGR01987 family)
MNAKDIRWEQRFDNFVKAFKKLSQAVEYVKNDWAKKEKDTQGETTQEIIDEILKEGLIQRFEYTYEMAWNVMKDYALYQGNAEIGGSRDAIRYAFANEIIVDGETWMDMIKSRIKTSHTYNEEIANDIFYKILKEYYPAFIQFKNKMSGKLSSSQNEPSDKK